MRYGWMMLCAVGYAAYRALKNARAFEQATSGQQFKEHLEWASREVEKWPSWKRNNLGPIPGKEEGRCQTCGGKDRLILIMSRVPRDMRMFIGKILGITYSLGEGSGIELPMTLCLDCGTVQGNWSETED